MGDKAFGNSKEYCLYNLNSFDIIEIGNDCFGSVQTFKIDGLNRLKSIKIGINSFTQNKNSYGDDQSTRIVVEMIDQNHSTY